MSIRPVSFGPDSRSWPQPVRASITTTAPAHNTQRTNTIDLLFWWRDGSRQLRKELLVGRVQEQRHVGAVGNCADTAVEEDEQHPAGIRATEGPVGRSRCRGIRLKRTED